MLIEDFKVKPKPLPRVRLHPHFACEDCRYVKKEYRENRMFRGAIVLNGVKPCKSLIKSRLFKRDPKTQVWLAPDPMFIPAKKRFKLLNKDISL